MNASERLAPWTNSSGAAAARGWAGLGMSCFTMIFGAVSNLTALGILARSHLRFRRRSRAPFLLLTVALLLADLAGHLVPGTFAMYAHVEGRLQPPGTAFCRAFGASMVFFGLCPLLLGGAMALERCVAITRPFLHAALVTAAQVRRVVLALPALPLLLAALPLLEVGSYGPQPPGTWCFLAVGGPGSAADSTLALAFSCLGLAALALSLLCNILSAAALLRARRTGRWGPAAARGGGGGGGGGRRASTASNGSALCSLDVEMMVQLAAITVVSCVCWSPFLVHIFLKQLDRLSSWGGGAAQQPDSFILLALRMASWNQILDPWVYILLRRAVLLRLCCSAAAAAAAARSSSSRRHPELSLN